MLAEQLSFRELYGRLWLIGIAGRGISEAGYAVCYCCIGRTQLSFEVLGFADSEGNGGFAVCRDLAPAGLRFTWAELSGSSAEPAEEKFYSIFAERIGYINKSSCGELEKVRKIRLIDRCRDRNCPDNVTVMLIKRGQNAEICRARCESISGGRIRGRLLNEPPEGFSVHKNDTIEFGLIDQNGSVICLAECG